MRISNQNNKINNNIKFKQRYFIPYQDIIRDGLSSQEAFQACFRLWRNDNSLPYNFRQQNRLLVATGKDEEKIREIFLAESPDAKSLAISNFLTGAVEFGQKQIAQIKALISSNCDYKVKIKGNNSDLEYKNLDVLAYATAMIDKKRVYVPVPIVGNVNHVLSDPGEDYIVVLVRSFDTWHQRMNTERTKQGITIGEVDKFYKKSLAELVQNEQTEIFGSEEAVDLVNKIREILHLQPITLKDYLSDTKSLKIVD